VCKGRGDTFGRGVIGAGNATSDSRKIYGGKREGKLGRGFGKTEKSAVVRLKGDGVGAFCRVK